MITLCIRYTIDIHKTRDFEQYARAWPEPIRRCGGELIGYFLPTKVAGPTNFALALINFPTLAAYERLMQEVNNLLRYPRGVFVVE
ncbi:MAG: NIPSNAP family protein [Candidatus Angelobacter sp. Gp1-AA117]|nr:MAG: NIPSNAP family protein [Candidatus Angelobacter sp. Gp1-AA117]